jgi:Putative beta-barrel porin-2, OmpL-like. bbp2
MKLNPWTVALVGAGIVSLPSVTKADEKIVAVQTAIASTTLSGYVDTSAQWNIGTGNANLPPYAFGGTSKADGFNLNVVKLQLEKPIDPAEIWGAGYKVDLLAGPDANTFSTQSPLATGKSDFAVKQAYVALHAPLGTGLDVKMGVWDTIIGYEVFESGNNPNFTRSYGYTMEPTTHTGILATYTVCPAFSVNLGVANTFGPTINGRANPPKSESFKTYMGSFTFTAPTNCGVLSGSTLTGCIISGYNTGVLGGAGESETSYYAGASLNTPVKGLTVGAAFDYMDVHNTSGETWVLGGYVGYHATEKLSFYARGEYLRDRGAQKLFVTGTGLGAVPLAPDRAMEITGTVQYDLWKNVMTRLEVRWDHSLTGGEGLWGGKTTNFSDGEGGIIGDGNQKNAVAVIANVIYKF